MITEVIIDETGGSTPAGEPADDDFFSSWDKPSIKKPTPPISRTATPPTIGRTPSPFLTAGANGKDIQRAASPLSKSETTKPDAAATEATKPAPAASSRVTSSAALRKTGAGAGPRKGNILGAKKATSKLGAKKVTGDVIDFDEAEKKAKEEAERIAKLGYDPDDEEEVAKRAAAAKAEAAAAAAAASAANVVAPTPLSPSRGGFGATQSREKSAQEMERLGMGVARLGFGQVGSKSAGASAAPKARGGGGFGSVGPIKATPDRMFLTHNPLAQSLAPKGSTPSASRHADCSVFYL